MSCAAVTVIDNIRRPRAFDRQERSAVAHARCASMSAKASEFGTRKSEVESRKRLVLPSDFCFPASEAVRLHKANRLCYIPAPTVISRLCAVVAEW